MDNCSRPPYAWCCGNKFFEIYPISVVHVALFYPSANVMWNKTSNYLLALYCSLHLLPLKVFHLRSREAELSVIYAVHYQYHGLPYEPYLWLSMRKPSLLAQQLKSILWLNIIATLSYCPGTPNTWV